MEPGEARFEISRVDEGVNERNVDACQAELPPEQRVDDIPEDNLADPRFRAHILERGWNVIDGEYH